MLEKHRKLSFYMKNYLNDASFFLSFVVSLTIGLSIMFTYASDIKQEWIGYWGNLLGGLIGGAVTIAAIKWTLIDERKNLHEMMLHEKEMQERQLQHDKETSFKSYMIFYSPFDDVLQMLCEELDYIQEKAQKTTNPIAVRRSQLKIQHLLDYYIKKVSDNADALKSNLPQVYDKYFSSHHVISNSLILLIEELSDIENECDKTEAIGQFHETIWFIKEYKNDMLKIIRNMVFA